MDSRQPYLIILAGGSGTRLWPLSRKDLPKQFLKIGSDRSLVQETADRLLPLSAWDRVLIVCGQNHAEFMRKDFPQLGDNQFLLEPCGKNTAAAIALAAHTILKKDPEGVMVVLPADHKILQDELKSFQDVVRTAVDFCQKNGGLLTLGVRPTSPATGYGYLQSGDLVQNGKFPVYRVRQFREKPDQKTAEIYLSSGDYSWNSGMFVWRASTYWETYQKFLPRDAKGFDSLPALSAGPLWEEALEKLYPNLTSISVDYAVLEKSDSVYTLSAPFRWDDIGSLNSLHSYFPRDASGNAREGNVVVLDSKNNLILSDEGVVACLGVENLVVIRNGNSLLILPRERSEEVKQILEEMKAKGLEKFL